MSGLATSFNRSKINSAIKQCIESSRENANNCSAKDIANIIQSYLDITLNIHFVAGHSDKYKFSIFDIINGTEIGIVYLSAI